MSYIERSNTKLLQMWGYKPLWDSWAYDQDKPVFKTITPYAVVSELGSIVSFNHATESAAQTAAEENARLHPGSVYYVVKIRLASKTAVVVTTSVA